jgi:hypothetical protein
MVVGLEAAWFRRGTPPGIYNFSVTATAGSANHSTPLALTVN